MQLVTPLHLSQALLSLLGTRTYMYHADRVPTQGAILVVSNHRSFLDAPLLMVAVNRSIRFACHHYMGQVPLMREVVTRMGCFPLDAPDHRQQTFFHQAIQLLQSQQMVGVFPEGAQPMVRQTRPEQIGEFQRGFAHLALRAPIADLAVLPIAICPQEEAINSAVPLRVLSLVDPSEPLFAQDGWHPLVVYRRVNVMIGRPRWVRAAEREQYRGKKAREIVTALTQSCHHEIAELLRQGIYF